MLLNIYNMPYDNEYNRSISRMVRDQIERRDRQLEEQHMNFENPDKFNELFQRGGGFVNTHNMSGFAEGPNEITGAFEHEKGIEGKGRVTYASVREKHLDQGVYGAGTGAGLFSDEIGGAKEVEVPYTDFISTMNPAKAQGSLQFGGNDDTTNLNGAGWWDDFKDGFTSVVKPLTGIISGIASAIPTPQGQAVGNATAWLNSVLGSGKKLKDFDVKDLRKLVKHCKLNKTIKNYTKMTHEELVNALEKCIKLEGGAIMINPITNIRTYAKQKRQKPTDDMSQTIQEPAKEGGNDDVIPAVEATPVEAAGKKKRTTKKKGGNMPHEKQMLKDGIRMELDGRKLLTAPQLPGNTGGSKEVKGKGLTEWRTLLLDVMKQNKLNMRDAIAKIKREGLYKKS